MTSCGTSCQSDGQPTMPPHLPYLVTLVLLVPTLCLCQTGGQFDTCRSEGGPGLEFYACQPSPANMKEVMQIRVDPPGITCGNPPQRFCTLVSHTHINAQMNTHPNIHLNTTPEHTPEYTPEHTIRHSEDMGCHPEDWHLMYPILKHKAYVTMVKKMSHGTQTQCVFSFSDFLSLTLSVSLTVFWSLTLSLSSPAVRMAAAKSLSSPIFLKVAHGECWLSVN